MRAEDQFHVGVVVGAFEAALAGLSSLFGYQWCDELGAPGTLWEPTAGSGIHHAGYWSDDVAADSAELERRGYLAEASRKGPDGVPFFAFYRSVTGFRVEPVSRIAQPGLERCWAEPTGDTA